ncbi:MAG: triple tyrosine motif-containing protein [Candidatus Pseudobacter hemicellulosilyticus]|uniref:Triple tyrosine motif-containing protein n=1 Tax=Candidatus Pseudobacter hemicellulosilyticus TaxID=3121375 RepID=A0AAJ6BEZ1_9BACT|nr:MAG: triple tyrosine motif-containing protein [Pseudobacter sp.]
MRWLLALLVVMQLPSYAPAQNSIGFPDILNYSKQQYQGGGQNWDAAIDRKGILYFANTEGLLTFDGHYWKLYPVPNNTRLRSVLTHESGRIYTGAQDELGYFFPNERGILQYTSLKHLLPDGRKNMADVWDIEEYDGAIFFRASDRLFEYRNNQIRCYDAPSEWRKLFRTGSGLYIQDFNEGLLQYNAGQWRTICDTRQLGDRLITSLHDTESGGLLLTTLKDGLFTVTNGRLEPWATEADPVFKTGRIYCAISLPDDALVAGTTSAGCYIINKRSGRIIQRFCMEEGLQNNNVLQLFADERRNIWLALDNGIDLIRYNTFVKQIYPNKKNLLTTYTAQVYHNNLYIGTSDGVYHTLLDGSADFSLSRNPFELVSNTKGQVWHLSVINDQLLLGHHEGTFLINNATATPLLKDKGCWLYKPYPANNSSQVLIGAYNGLYRMKSNGKQFLEPTPFSGLTESLRFLSIDRQNRVWASHPYRGIYQLSLLGDSLGFRCLGSREGLPSSYENFVYKVRNRVVVATLKGIYEYDERQGRFQPSADLHSILGNVPVQYLAEDGSGNIWFVSDKVPGIIDFHKPANGHPYSIIYFPELKRRIVSGFEFIYPYDEENIFLAAEQGIYHINYKNYSRFIAEPAVAIGRVRASGQGDSLLFNGYFASKNSLLPRQDPRQQVQLPNGYNNFRFEFASPAYDQGRNIEYSYRLTDFDAGWSQWAPKTEKEYTNLPYGSYTFQVKARDNLGNESAMEAYSFRILPAWYQTKLAHALYILAGLLLLYQLYRQQKNKFAEQQRKHREEQERLIVSHQLELERNEKELIKVQNDKLESDVHFKNRELATVTMHLVERGRVLSAIREKLVETIRKQEPPVSLTNFRRVLRLFEEAENNEEDWEHFARHFDEVHSNYLSTIKKHFPTLSITDLKLCAYLHINLTSKEIAQLLGISVRGVETSRYRLRKKLNIPGDIALNTFLQEAIAAPPEGTARPGPLPVQPQPLW